MRRQSPGGGQSGFSLIELMVAMAVTLLLMGLASNVLMQCFNVRTRQDSRSAAIADVQRALNIMSREIASAGFGLSTNGVVGCTPGGACDSDDTSIRVRSNTNRFDTTTPDADTLDDGEDVKFFLNDSSNTRYLVRYNANAAAVADRPTVLANRIDAMQFYYYDRRVTYTTATFDPDAPDAPLITNVRDSANAAATEVAPDLAKYVVIAVVVGLPAVGTPDTDGYQPETQEMLVSDVTLRNNDLSNY